MVLLLFLADFASMSISTDNVRYSLKPDSLNISWLFKIGLSLGIMNMIEGVLFTTFLLSYFDLSGGVNRLYTFTFAYLVLTGLFTLMMVRERSHFWKSRPSTLLILTMVGEILLVTVISLFGFLELAPLGCMTLFGTLGYVLFVSFLINDPIKVYLIRKLTNNTNYNKNITEYE
jgi:H+-transporting ATPase